MNQRSPIWTGAVAGMIVGSATGFLLFTPSGQRFLRELESRLGDLIVELQRARSAVERAQQAARRGWETAQRLDAALRPTRADVRAFPR